MYFAHLLVYGGSVELLAFYHQHGLSRVVDKLVQKYNFFMKGSIFGGHSYRIFSTFLTIHSIFKVLAKPAESEQSSITFIWPWHFLHTGNCVISALKDSVEMIIFLLRELDFLTSDVLLQSIISLFFLKVIRNNHYHYQSRHGCFRHQKKIHHCHYLPLYDVILHPKYILKAMFVGYKMNTYQLLLGLQLQ